MKKLLIVSLLLLGAAVVKADVFGDQLKTSLLSQVQPVTQFGVDGKSRIALLDDILQIGHYNGDYLGFAQVGPNSTIDSGAQRIEGYLIGGSFNWRPILKTFIKLPDGWKFLNEQFIVSTGYHYNTGSRHGEFSYLQLSVVVPMGGQ